MIERYGKARAYLLKWSKAKRVGFVTVVLYMLKG